VNLLLVVVVVVDIVCIHEQHHYLSATSPHVGFSGTSEVTKPITN